MGAKLVNGRVCPEAARLQPWQSVHDVIDLLIERNPDFRAHCHVIRERMDSGQFQTHEDVRKRLVAE